MGRVRLWEVTADRPKSLQRGQVGLETYLEEWIEHDPDMLEAGLRIVGRQVSVEGGTLDLLAVDPQAAWYVIEVKRGKVNRETIGQALDYASSIGTMAPDRLTGTVRSYLQSDAPGAVDVDGVMEHIEGALTQDGMREVGIFVVGTRHDPSLGRMVSYLSEVFGMPISVVTYEVFQTEGGSNILSRELTEGEMGEETSEVRTVEGVCQLADGRGVGEGFRALLEAAKRNGLYARPWRNCIMYTSPADKRRTLFTAWGYRGDSSEGIYIYLVPQAFDEFYDIPEQRVIDALGPAGDRQVPLDEVDEFARNFARNLDELFDASDAADEGVGAGDGTP